MSWDPGRYLVFQEERERPALDLLARIPEGVFRAVDLGCGPGNSTELVLRRFPGAAVLGVDSSSEMIETARRRLPGVLFETADIAEWRGEDACDLIFANAALQWVPDHATLLPRLLGHLAPGGTLAIQMPDNLDEPTHRAMREVAANGPWAGLLSEAVMAREPRRDAGWYFELLRGAGASPEVWRTTYHHPLAGAEAVVEWFRSTGLRPYLDPLEPDMRDAFLDAYREAVARVYPALSDGTILLPFPRLFLLARV